MFHPEQQLLWQLWIKGFLLEVGQATFGFSFDFVPNNFTIDFVFVFTYVSHKKFENEALPRALTYKTIFQPLNIPSWSVERGFFQSLYTYGPSNWYWKKIWSSFLYPIAAKWLVFALSFETLFLVVMTSILPDGFVRPASHEGSSKNLTLFTSDCKGLCSLWI